MVEGSDGRGRGVEGAGGQPSSCSPAGGGRGGPGRGEEEEAEGCCTDQVTQEIYTGAGGNNTVVQWALQDIVGFLRAEALSLGESLVWEAREEGREQVHSLAPQAPELCRECE